MVPDPALAIPDQLQVCMADLKGGRLHLAEDLERISSYFLDEGGGFERLGAFMKAHFESQELEEIRASLARHPSHPA